MSDGAPESFRGWDMQIEPSDYLSLGEVLFSSMFFIKKEETFVIDLNIFKVFGTTMLVIVVADHLVGFLQNTADWEGHAPKNFLLPEKTSIMQLKKSRLLTQRFQNPFRKLWLSERHESSFRQVCWKEKNWRKWKLFELMVLECY